MSQNIGLGTERISRLLRAFALPCIFSLIVSCLYNIVDQIFVGNGIGYLGNAATGIIFPVTVVGWGVSLLFGDGAAAYLSVCAGKNDKEAIPGAVANSIVSALLGGLLIALLGYCLGDQLLYGLGATKDTISFARDYGFIIYAMMPLALAQNAMASIIRADGSPKYAMTAMLAGALVNIIGDPLTIFAWGMGICGAAYATVFGQFVSFVLCAWYFRKSRLFMLDRQSFRPDLPALQRVVQLGASSFLTQLSIVVVTVVNNVLLVCYGAVSSYGPDIPLAAFVVIMKLFQIVINIAIGIAAGAQPVAGYNYGSGAYERVRILFLTMLRWTSLAGLAATAVFELVPGFLISLFGANGELYVEFATACLRIYLSLIVLTCVQKVCAIFLQSIGKAALAAPLAIVRDVLLLVFSIVLPMHLGVQGIFFAAPIADIAAMLITVPVMMKIWHELKLPQNRQYEPVARLETDTND